MSRITVIVNEVPAARRTEAVARLRAVTGKGMAEIARSLSSGVPLLSETLFFNNHDEVALRLRRFVSELVDMGARFQIFELPSNDTETGTLDPTQEITPTVLTNILDAHDERTRRREQDDRA